MIRQLQAIVDLLWVSLRFQPLGRFLAGVVLLVVAAIWWVLSFRWLRTRGGRRPRVRD